ncbi:class I SAM-dependent methyltransferase [Mucilaginibacter hurinus]|uniref:Class I SAM-dependent methyltransferase n=1 Tax=Mucilaginibacter hurinus TaxID=2201324 RepID=A0A367GMC8_9SPHI|nr:class I SAM-dependent methyltransferase [Mucilaginibacter hurinus]RCH54624.1 class I SAM-dependent methyltransferase [Mucilaginibacter hurinus]
MSELYRYDMIQACINVIQKRKQKVNYLEIGVQTGFCFFKIKADCKVAVDPDFIIKLKNKVKAYFKNPSNFNNKFFELTSDDFFSKQREYISEIGGFDVVFIDGLHLFEQVLIDIENSLKYLNPGGVILVHDCNPLTEIAAVRAYTSTEVAQMNLPGWVNIWNGDVWKAIVGLRATRNDLDITVINTDHGVGLITKGSAKDTLTLTKEAGELAYSELDENRTQYLNLKGAEYFSTFIKEFEKRS